MIKGLNGQIDGFPACCGAATFSYLRSNAKSEIQDKVVCTIAITNHNQTTGEVGALLEKNGFVPLAKWQNYSGPDKLLTLWALSKTLKVLGAKDDKRASPAATGRRKVAVRRSTKAGRRAEAR